MPNAETLPSAETLATIASIVTAAGVTVLLFRVQREVDIAERPLSDSEREADGPERHADQQRRRGGDQAETEQTGVPNWIAVADWLLLAAAFAATALVLLPLLFFDDRRVPTAGCATAVAALAGYPFALLAHYRLVFGAGRTGDRTHPEPAELVIVILVVAVAIVLFILSLDATA